VKYLIIGTGGTGGSIGGFLAMKGHDVTFISRGANLEAFKKNGLELKSGVKGNHQITDINFVSADDYKDKADVIFVCVKSYSVSTIIDLVEKATHKDSIIIPIMNGYNMGDSISKEITLGHAIEGCIYISAFVESPGTIVQLGQLFKVVFGQKSTQSIDTSKLKEIQTDLQESGIDTILSENIERDTFKKFTFISAYAACGAYYDITAEGMQREGEYQETFKGLCKEIETIGQALNLELDVDIVEANMNILHSLTPDTTASMQKDMKAGKAYEMDGLVFETYRLGQAHGISTPNYKKIASHFNFSK